MLLYRTTIVSSRYHHHLCRRCPFNTEQFVPRQVSLRFSSLGDKADCGNSGANCSRGRDSSPSGNSAIPLYVNEANLTSQEDRSFMPHHFGKKRKHGDGERLQHGLNKFSDSLKGLPKVKPFDICLSGIRSCAKYTGSLNGKNRENLNEMGHIKVEGTKQRILRPGMVLLKQYITLSEQVEMVKNCRDLGLGPGGFYQPGFQGGGKLHLQMMCLGMDWDPQTKKYEDRRHFDGSEPPCIPHEFSLLVKRAIQDAHALVKKECRVSNVEDILPSMSPNICIVNFYTTSGKLGLHQDRDESSESLSKGLPVVSLSVGDSAEFLYGDQRNVEEAERVVLESGDVLIFGGKSRHIFHGVPSVIRKSAPKALLEETGLCPGRLNLTFRQF
ncbi:hypothetical protein FH972_017070 [Carpinus fangiana]|uniref:DNA N(6)-methyladenine demethylase n=1 Tax=Carpinus fangiana TaxID=176857 RepID=A0A5N6RLB4_9ROSI|nr:hypothetical protein FH972_017070 [Carpinus fangiana]